MAANPFAYAVTQVQKKAQQLFNPVGQAISRVPQQFGNYIQKTPQYQGAQMYQKAFQSPQVQNFVRQAPTQVIRLGQSVNSAVNAPYNAVNRQMAPVLQQTRNMPLMQRVDTVLPKAAKAFSSNLLPGYVPNVVNPLMDLGYNAAKSAAKPFIPSDVKKYYGIRETGFEDVGNIAGGLGAANIPGNIVGGAIGVGMNRLPVVGSNGKVSDAQAFDEGFKFSAKLGPLGKLAETPLKGLLNKINPKTVNTVNSLVSQKLYKEAAKLLVRRAGASAVSGGVGFGVYNTTLPAKNLQERVANALEGIATGAAFGAGTSIGGDVLGTGAKQLQRIYKNKPKLGMQSADAVMAPTDILISHEGAPDKARVEYYKKLIQSGKKVDPIVIINEGAKYGIEDGKHRFQAYKELGYNQVPVIFKGGEEYQQMMARAESSVKLPTQVEGLAKEASKYKSAEEFVKAIQDGKVEIPKGSPETIAKLQKELGMNFDSAYKTPDGVANMQKKVITDLYNQAHTPQPKPVTQAKATVSVEPKPETPLAKSERLHQEKLARNKLTQNEYAGLHQNVTDLENKASELHRKVSEAMDAEPRKADGTFANPTQPRLKKAIDDWGKAQDDHLNALNQVRKIDGQEPIVLGKRSTPKPSLPTQVEGLAKEVQLSDKPYNFKYTSDEMPTTGKTITYQGKEVGGIGYGKDLNQKDAWLHNIEIDPQYRNKGIGKKAIDQFFQTSGANKVNGYAESPEAAKFFKSLGAKVDTDGNFTLSKTDFFNQSKGVQNAVQAGIKGVEHSQYTTKGANKNYVIFDDSAVKPSLPTQVEGLANKPYYHGTSAQGVTKLKPGGIKGRMGENQIPGVYLTDNYGDASYYAKKNGVQINSPIETRIKGKILEVKDVSELKSKIGLNDWSDTSRSKIPQLLSDKGYDGVKILNGGEKGEVIITNPKAVSIFNQSKGVQNADLSIKLPVAPQVVNGKIKMRPISAPTLEKPVALSSSQEVVGSGAGGGSSIKNTKEFVNPQDPYFNVKRLNVNPKKQQAVKVAIEEAKPQFEAVVGKKLSNKEVVDFSNQSAKVLNRAVNREQTKQWSASMLKAREQLAKSAQDDRLTPEFLDTLINVKSQGADIARKLQSLSINADPKTVTAKQAILEAVLKVTNNSDDILSAAKGVDFNDQAQATAFYRQFVKPNAEDWLTLVRYNSMLSSPNTHIVNTSSNFQGTGIVAPIEKTVLGGIDWMRSKATGTSRRYYAGEGVEYAKGYYSSIKEASKNFSKVMRGESMSGNPDIRQLPLTTKKGIAQTTEKVLNYPMRLLEGMDQFFSTLTKGGVEQSLNYRASQGVKVGNIASKAEQEAAERLFRGELSGAKQGTVLNAIDQVTNLVFRARSNDNPIVRTMAQFTFPFVKTPMNIVKQMVEYSPLGVTTLPGARFKQEQLAKAILGSSVALGAAQLLSSDRLTWAEPTSEKQRNAFRSAGLQPYAIKIGDKWVSYSKLHPVIGFNLAMVSALDDAFKNKKLSESEVETALTGLAKWWGYFADQSYVKNMGDLVSSARGDVSGIARMISNYPTQVIPFRALMSWVERLVDPYQRQADPDGSILEKQLQLIGSQLPGIAGNIPTRKNIYGEPVENQNRLLNSFSPAKVTTERSEQKKILDDMQEKSRLEKQIKDIKSQAKKGVDVTEGTDSTYMGSDDVMKARFQASGAGSWNIGGKLYIKTDSDGVKVVDLQPNPTGNAIQQAKQSASNESQIKTTGVNAYFSTKLSDFDKNTIYKALGTNAQDVEFKALASLPDEKQASVLYSLLKERKWKQEKVDAFIKSNVLTSSVVGKMEDQGLINEAQAKDLKAYIKSTSIKLGKVSGSSKKAKKIKMPKLKAIKVKYSKLKIKIPKPKKYKSLLSKGRSNKYFK